MLSLPWHRPDQRSDRSGYHIRRQPCRLSALRWNGFITVTQTVILRGDAQRALARRLIDVAPDDAVVKVSAPVRTSDQNAKMWAMLSDISRAKPSGRKHTPEVWKCIFMQALGHKVRFEEGLEGEPFPIGFHSSNLTRRQMADMIEFMFSYGSEHGVLWSDSQGR